MCLHALETVVSLSESIMYMCVDTEFGGGGGDNECVQQDISTHLYL